MPIRQRKKTSSPKADDLRSRLIREWENPDDKHDQPVIVLEGDRVFVIWDEWSAMPQQERSEIIMDAHEEVNGLEKAAQTTVAMGLTVEEAERMNIHYE